MVMCLVGMGGSWKVDAPRGRLSFATRVSAKRVRCRTKGDSVLCRRAIIVIQSCAKLQWCWRVDENAQGCWVAMDLRSIPRQRALKGWGFGAHRIKGDQR